MSEYFVGHYLPIIRSIVGHLPFWDRLHTAPLVCKKWATVSRDAETSKMYPLPSRLQQRALWLIKYHLLGDGMWSRLLRKCLPCVCSRRRLARIVCETHKLLMPKISRWVWEYEQTLTNSQRIPYIFTRYLLPYLSNDENLATHEIAKRQFPAVASLQIINAPFWLHPSNEDLTTILCVVRHILSSVSVLLKICAQNAIIPYHVVIEHLVDVLQNAYGIPCTSLSDWAQDHLKHGPEREEFRLEKRSKK